jgi:hypothetical protein
MQADALLTGDPMFARSYTDAMPQRVRAALNYVDHCKSITNPEDEHKGRELDPMEARVYRLALEVLARYFSGEMDFGDHPPQRREAEAEPPAAHS